VHVFRAELSVLFERLQAQQQRVLEEIPRIVAQALPPAALDSEVILSPAHLAVRVNKQLQAQRDADVAFEEPADGSGTPVLVAEEQALVNDVRSESAMVARLTPYLWRWLCGENTPAHRCLVNSETKKWLEVEPGEGQLNRKPDMWLGPAYLVEQLPAPAAGGGNAPEQEAAGVRAEVAKSAGTQHVPYVFGKPVSNRWFDSVFPLAAKLSLTDEAMGEEMIYLKHLSDADHPFSRGMAYDKTTFVLLKCVNKKIAWRMHGRWTQRGAGEQIRAFFSIESEWEAAVGRCCAILAVQPVRFLGCGGTARVIEVRHSSGQLLALKTVLEPHLEQLASEYCRLRALVNRAQAPDSAAAALRAVLVDAVGSHVELPDKSAACFLLSPVGEAVDRREVLKSRKSFRSVFHALRVLHVSGERHGDPRLPNLLRRTRSSPRAAEPSLVARLATLRVAPVAAASASSSSSSHSAVHVHDPIVPPGALGPGLDAAAAAPSAADPLSVVWVDFMVSNARTELDSGDHRFDEDLLLFVSYLAARRFTRADAPEPLRRLMLEYHQRLAAHGHDSIPDADAFLTFLRASAKHALSPDVSPDPEAAL
jgi:hypothetical protein